MATKKTGKKAGKKTAAKKTAAKKTAAKKSAAKKSAAKKPAAKKATAKKKASSSKAPAAKKPAAEKKAAASKASSQDVNLGHVFALRPRVGTSFRPDDFRSAKQSLAEEPFESIQAAARAVAEKALELTHDGPVSGGTRRRR